MSAVGLRLRLGGGAGIALRPMVHLQLGDGNWACLERRLGRQGDSRCVCPDGRACAALQRGGERSAERGTLSVGTACLMGVVCCVVGDSLPPPPGWRCICAGSCSPHVADAQVGEILGYARLPPPAGVAEMSAFGHRLRLGRGRCAAAQRSGEERGALVWRGGKREPLRGGGSRNIFNF